MHRGNDDKEGYTSFVPDISNRRYSKKEPFSNFVIQGHYQNDKLIDFPSDKQGRLLYGVFDPDILRVSFKVTKKNVKVEKVRLELCLSDVVLTKKGYDTQKIVNSVSCKNPHKIDMKLVSSKQGTIVAEVPMDSVVYAVHQKNGLIN